MADPREKFKDQRWLARREEVLERANFKCEDCDSLENLQVHICFYVRGKEPWEFPSESFKCYCPEHREQRQRLERDILRSLAFFTSDELGSLQNALELLAQIETNRAVSMERLYLFAKREYSSSNAALTEETH